MKHAKPHERLIISFRKTLYKLKIALKMTIQIKKENVVSAYVLIEENILLLHINVPDNVKISNTMDFVTFDFDALFMSKLQGIEIQYISHEQSKSITEANPNIFNRHKKGQNGMSATHTYQLV